MKSFVWINIFFRCMFLIRIMHYAVVMRREVVMNQGFSSEEHRPLWIQEENERNDLFLAICLCNRWSNV